jgi:predicted nucleic acid-binding protein
MYLLDSNILIYASQPGNEFLDPWLTAEGTRISAISIPEVLGFTGLSAEDETIFEVWFARFSVHAVTEPILRRAAALRRQRRMRLGDSIIAATTLEIGGELVTRNVGDFAHVAGLKLTNPFAPRESA